MNSSFIKNLSEKINKTIVYSPTGKYGKKELDSVETARAKMDLFFSAMPSKPEEIRDYVLFAKTVGAFKISKVRKKVEILLNVNDLSDSYIKQANEVFRAEKKKVLIKSIALLLPILIVAGLLWAWYDSYIQDWDTIWQVLCYIFIFPMPVSASIFPIVCWMSADVF